MKKLMRLFVIAVFLLLPIMVNAKPNVEITKVVLGPRSEGTEIVKNATFDGLNVNFDVKFSEVGDYVIYKVTIKNNDNVAYQLEQGKVFKGSKYISYETKYDGGNVIKAKSTKQATILISYDNPVPADKFVDGKFEEADNMSISLGDSSGGSNPQTSTTGAVILLVLLLLTTGTVIVVKGNTKAKLLTVMVLSLSIPFTALAISRVTITINSKVQIVKGEGQEDKKQEFCIVDPETARETNYEFTYGQKISEFCNDTSNSTNALCKSETTNFIGMSLLNCYKQETPNTPRFVVPKASEGTVDDDPCAQYIDDYFDVNENDKIQSKEDGCYIVNAASNVENAEEKPSK